MASTTVLVATDNAVAFFGGTEAILIHKAVDTPEGPLWWKVVVNWQTRKVIASVSVNRQQQLPPPNPEQIKMFSGTASKPSTIGQFNNKGLLVIDIGRFLQLHSAKNPMQLRISRVVHTA